MICTRYTVHTPETILENCFRCWGQVSKLLMCSILWAILHYCARTMLVLNTLVTNFVGGNLTQMFKSNRADWQLMVTHKSNDCDLWVIWLTWESTLMSQMTVTYESFDSRGRAPLNRPTMFKSTICLDVRKISGQKRENQLKKGEKLNFLLKYVLFA